jgi:hypothetical protein
MPACCLAASMHPEGSGAGQLNPGLSQSQGKCSVGIQRFSCSPHRSKSKVSAANKVFPNSKRKLSQTLMLLLLRAATVSLPPRHLLHRPTLYLVTSLPLPEGRAGITWEPSALGSSLFPLNDSKCSPSDCMQKSFASLFILPIRVTSRLLFSDICYSSYCWHYLILPITPSLTFHVWCRVVVFTSIHSSTLYCSDFCWLITWCLSAGYSRYRPPLIDIVHLTTANCHFILKVTFLSLENGRLNFSCAQRMSQTTDHRLHDWWITNRKGSRR